MANLLFTGLPARGFYLETFIGTPRDWPSHSIYEVALMPQPPAPNPNLPLTSTIPSDKSMWQPRVGLSWGPGNDGRTVVRLGGGIFHGRTPYLLVNQAVNSNGNPDVGVTFDLVAPQIDAVQRVRPEFVFPFVPDTSEASGSSYFTSLGLNVRPDVHFLRQISRIRDLSNMAFQSSVNLLPISLAVSLMFTATPFTWREFVTSTLRV
jgi:hypothetical protein